MEYLLDIIFDPGNIYIWIIIIAIIAATIAVFARAFSTYVKFIYPNAKYEAIGNPYIKEKELFRLVDSKNLSNFMDSLNNSKDYDVKGDNAYDVQKSLDNHLLETIDMMRKDSSKSMNDFFDIYLEKYDMYYLKKLLKNKIQNKEAEEELIEKPVLSKNKKLFQKIFDIELEKTSEVLKQEGFSYELVSTVKKEGVKPREIDIAVDRFFIDTFRNVAVPRKCEKAKKRFVNTFIDIYNIKNLLRAQQNGYSKDKTMQMFLGEGQEIRKWKYEQIASEESVSQIISSLEGTSYYNILKDRIEEYNKEKTVQVLENSLDSLFLDMVKDISTENYVTIGPTIRFISSKEKEIQNLRVIAKGIAASLSSNEIKKYLIYEVKQ